MSEKLANSELNKMYQIIKAFNEGLLVNPSEEWELEYHDEPLVDKRGLNILLKKIEKLLSKGEVEQIKRKILRRRFDIFNNEIDENVYNIIEKAFNARKTIEIAYFDMNSAEVKKREIDIYHKTRKYIVAYCHLRLAIRKFRTSRVVSAKLTNKPYTIPHDFNRNNY